jgi:hypothetical protein
MAGLEHGSFMREIFLLLAPPNNPTFREYEELKRQGWYKEDKA